MENSEIDPYKYSQLTSEKDTKAICWRRKSFQQMALEQLDIRVKKINLDIDLLSFKKINSKEVRHLSTKL